MVPARTTLGSAGWGASKHSPLTQQCAGMAVGRPQKDCCCRWAPGVLGSGGKLDGCKKTWVPGRGPLLPPPPHRCPLLLRQPALTSAVEACSSSKLCSSSLRLNNSCSSSVSMARSRALASCSRRWTSATDARLRTASSPKLAAGAMVRRAAAAAHTRTPEGPARPDQVGSSRRTSVCAKREIRSRNAASAMCKHCGDRSIAAIRSRGL